MQNGELPRPDSYYRKAIVEYAGSFFSQISTACLGDDPPRRRDYSFPNCTGAICDTRKYGEIARHTFSY